MKFALIGHRGVGKTSILKRIQNYYNTDNRKVRVRDLDGEIENSVGRSVSSIFRESGEAEFRRRELEIFTQYDQDNPAPGEDLYLALGAGFPVDKIPQDWLVIWIQRATDLAGRIFIDRPRLDPTVDPLQEYRDRFQLRDGSYSSRADHTLVIEEGRFDVCEGESDFFLGRISGLNACLSLQRDHFSDRASLLKWWSRRREWGLRFVELRDDLLSKDQISLALEVLPHSQTLLSFRDAERMLDSKELVTKFGLAFDWPATWSEGMPEAIPNIVSVHESSDRPLGIEEAIRALQPFSSRRCLLKLAFRSSSFLDLKKGDAWQAEQPLQRVFLPMSDDRRWTWYRLRQSCESPINFIREGAGSASDQPTLIEFLRHRKIRKTLTQPLFAAVIGDPVAHSWSPTFHSETLAPLGLPFYRILIERNQMDFSTMQILKELGLRWAAVTSPHKQRARQLSTAAHASDEHLDSFNTLSLNSDHSHFLGTNTDRAGLLALLLSTRRNFSQGETTAVWGGGGMIGVVRDLLPDANFYSARQGGPRAATITDEEFRPRYLIWAAGAWDTSSAPLPANWSPELVVDLSYSENSGGRHLALEYGAEYFSGESMFFAQARAQQEFWRFR